MYVGTHILFYKCKHFKAIYIFPFDDLPDIIFIFLEHKGGTWKNADSAIKSISCICKRLTWSEKDLNNLSLIQAVTTTQLNIINFPLEDLSLLHRKLKCSR